MTPEDRAESARWEAGKPQIMSEGGGTMDPTQRGVDVPLRKIQTWPQAIVACVGVIAVGGIVVALALAGWSSEAIIGFGALAASVAAGQFVQARKTAEIDAKTDQQTDILQTVVRQTNGKSDDELQEIADRAAVKVIEAYRNGGLR